MTSIKTDFLEAQRPYTRSHTEGLSNSRHPFPRPLPERAFSLDPTLHPRPSSRPLDRLPSNFGPFKRSHTDTLPREDIAHYEADERRRSQEVGDDVEGLEYADMDEGDEIIDDDERDVERDVREYARGASSEAAEQEHVGVAVEEDHPEETYNGDTRRRVSRERERVAVRDERDVDLILDMIDRVPAPPPGHRSDQRPPRPKPSLGSGKSASETALRPKSPYPSIGPPPRYQDPLPARLPPTGRRERDLYPPPSYFQPHEQPRRLSPGRGRGRDPHHTISDPVVDYNEPIYEYRRSPREEEYRYGSSYDYYGSSPEMEDEYAYDLYASYEEEEMPYSYGGRMPSHPPSPPLHPAGRRLPPSPSPGEPSRRSPRAPPLRTREGRGSAGAREAWGERGSAGVGVGGPRREDRSPPDVGSSVGVSGSGGLGGVGGGSKSEEELESWLEEKEKEHEARLREFYTQQLEQRIQQLRRQAQAEIDNVKAECDRKMRILEKEAAKETTESKSSSRELDSKVSSLQANLEAANRQVTEFSAKNEMVMLRKNQLEKRLDETLQQKEELMRTVQTLQETYEEATRLLAAHKDTVRRLEKENEDVQANCAALAHTKKVLQGQVESLEETKTTQEREIQHLQADFKELQTKHQTATQSLNKLEGEYESLSKEAKKLKTDLEKAEEEAKRCEELQSKNETLIDQMKDRDKTRKHELAQMAQTMQESESMRKESQKAKGELENEKRKSASLAAQNETAMRDAQRYRDQHEKAQRQLQEQSNELLDLRQQLHALKKAQPPQSPPVGGPAMAQSPYVTQLSGQEGRLSAEPAYPSLYRDVGRSPPLPPPSQPSPFQPSKPPPLAHQQPSPPYGNPYPSQPPTPDYGGVMGHQVNTSTVTPPPIASVYQQPPQQQPGGGGGVRPSTAGGWSGELSGSSPHAGANLGGRATGVGAALNQGMGLGEVKEQGERLQSLEQQLLTLNMENAMIDSELSKFPSGSAGKTVAQRKRRMELERRQMELDATIARVRSSLRELRQLKR
ncbi:unnamed protein product [Vitrella brassicaformis CCMP3155]|uniref:Enkurin domain-containing protein n=3 Tax=Vitrella brassicaformis TaxID=1169539 RepID=A0A0G4ELD1_VITBC|nr:unnamed protein product [Vitrella brassicaformis CCMP3155]|eukprot:CEL98222.1 unnamed protein product [Vitrella brassicaformis CCMP3155]